jgi:uncharacterized membrane protein YfcA
MPAWMLYLTLGSGAGILAGLLGVGGGLVIVPLLTFAFSVQHFSASYVVHMALGTSLATITFTSISSLRAHHARQAVNWPVVRRITPGIVAGTLLGSWAAAHMSTGFLKIFFICFIYFVAVQMILDISPEPGRQLPGKGGLSLVGSLIGVVSSLVGIGGGTMSVPFLQWCNLPFKIAIGTSAAIGFPIALSGAVGYIANGLAVRDLPPASLGFVYLPALAGVAVASYLTAPLGVRMAHSLPVAKLKKIFAILLIATGTKMLISLF